MAEMIDLLAHFKAKESEYRQFVPENSVVVARFDGSNFKRFTKIYERPYDKTFANAMNEVAFRLCQVVTGALFAYVQSDEVSVAFTDLKTTRAQHWMNGRVEKLLTLGAANATARYMQVAPREDGEVPIFDGRLSVLDNMDELRDYVEWRRADARKNSITMAANVLYSHNALEGVSTYGRHALLEGTEYEVLPDDFYHGRIVFREEFNETITIMPRNSDVPKSLDVSRSRWVIAPATLEKTNDVFAREVLRSSEAPE